MGFLTTQDRIGNVSYSPGIITLQPSLLTIGGQQYRTPTLNVSLSGLTANTLYMVYVVMTGPTSFQLVVSGNYNSVGPAGYTKWKLVGAFYAGSATTIGGLINISDTPKAYFGSEAFVPTVGSGSMTNYSASMQKWRDEDRLIQRFSIKFTGVPGTWSDIQIPLPSTLSADPLKIVGGSDRTVVGSLEILDSGSEFYYGTVLYGTATAMNSYAYATKAHTGTVPLPGSTISNLFPMSFVSTDSINGVFEVPISGWSNTPIAYL